MEEDNDEGGGDGWLVSYADLMTLLFAAFVVLYGTITEGTDDAQRGVVAAAMRESFAEFSALVTDDDQLTEKIKMGAFVFKARAGDTLSNEGPKQAVIKQDAFVTIDRDTGIVNNFLDKIATEKGKKDLKLRSSMIASPTEKGVTIKLMGAYFFDENSYRLTTEGRKRFLKLGGMLKKLKRSIRIEGHTDKAEGGIRFSNDELAGLRAANAAQLLRNEVGFVAHLLDTISYQDTEPMSPGKAEKNRRIEIKLLY